MARYQIISWMGIPAQLKVSDDKRSIDEILPERFQKAIDAAALAAGRAETDAYLDGWKISEPLERAGTAPEVLEALLSEIEAEYSPARLAAIVRAMVRRGASANRDSRRQH